MTTYEARWLTFAFMLAITAIVIIYDVWVIGRFGPDASISRVVAFGFGRYPILAALTVYWLGILTGHIGFPAFES